MLKYFATVVAIAMAVAAPAAAGAAAGGAPSEAATVPHVPGVADLGAAPATQRVDIAVTLAYRDPAGLSALLRAQTDPRSPFYRHWLSNEQFAAAFGPTPAAEQRVVDFLAAHGFRVTQRFANRTVVDAIGTVAAADAAFATRIDRVRQAGAGTRIANVLPASVPAELRGAVFSVGGLDTLDWVRPHYARVQPRPFRTAVDHDPRLYGPVSSVTNAAGFGPLAFTTAYDLPARHTAVVSGKRIRYDGTGRSAGIVIDADYLNSDLSRFLRYFNVTRTGPATSRVLIDGGPPPGLASPDSLETTLDVETLASNAPGVALVVYEFPNFHFGKYITDAYNRVVSDNAVDTANSSFGGCEQGEVTFATTWNHIAQQGAAKGITFHASSGDFGAFPCGSSNVSVDAPASGDAFVAIGGTTLSVDAKGGYDTESVWGGSGGGVSTIFALPAWQTGVKNIVTSGRNVPDVSFDADPNTGAAFYYGSSWDTPYDPLGGTSLSSPLFGAAVVEQNQVQNGRSGLAASTIFAQWMQTGYKVPHGLRYYHPISSGCNGAFCANGGYSQATGIGSMNVWNDVNAGQAGRLR